jgi:opacity protein-like surface antigen
LRAAFQQDPANAVRRSNVDDDNESVQVPIDIPVDVPVDIPFATASINPVSTSFNSHTTKAGWALGAGAEVRLGGNWTGKIEYLYLDFGKVSTTASLPTNSTPLGINFNSRVMDHMCAWASITNSIRTKSGQLSCFDSFCRAIGF